MDNSEKAALVFDKHAMSYQEKFMDVALYSDSLDLFCSLMSNPNASVLELACGPGNITRYLYQKIPTLKILGIDLAPKMIELAKINNPTADFMVMDCREIDQLSQRYDAMMCSFCLPYLTKEESIQLISNSANLLNSNGVLYLSTMEDDYNRSGFKTGSQGDQIYMNYHQEDYISETLIKNGFEIINIKHQIYPTNDSEKVIDLIIIARKI